MVAQRGRDPIRFPGQRAQLDRGAGFRRPVAGLPGERQGAFERGGGVRGTSLPAVQNPPLGQHLPFRHRIVEQSGERERLGQVRRRVVVPALVHLDDRETGQRQCRRGPVTGRAETRSWLIAASANLPCWRSTRPRLARPLVSTTVSPAAWARSIASR